ncbi:MAG: hypothetical protein R6T92_07675 [Desulfosalsimonadaceae bacterium]
MKKTVRQLWLTLLAATATWMVCTSLQASEGHAPPELDQSPPAVTAPVEDEKEPNVLLRITFGGVVQSGLEKEDAAYTLGCSVLEAGAGPVSGSFKVLHFSWDRPGAYVIDTKGRDPWRDLYEVSIGANHGGMITERMSYAVTLGAASAHEREPDDSFSLLGGGYGMFAITPKWTIAGGLLYSKHQKVEADFEFIPVASVSWNTETTRGPSFTIGLPATELAWHFSKTTTLTLDTSGFESGIYRLADSSPVRKKGYVEFSGTTGSLRFDTLIAGRIGLRAGITQALSRKHKLFDHQGKNEIKYDVEKKPGFFVSVAMPF